jgi:uncharacterized repeat protein (TIGR01451 family)
MKSFSQHLFFVFFLYFLSPVQVAGQWTELLTPVDDFVSSVIFFDNQYWGLNQNQLYKSFDGKLWKKHDQQFNPNVSTHKLIQDNGRLMAYDYWTGSYFSISTDSAKTWQTYDWAAQGITNLKQLLVSGNTLMRVSENNVFRSTDFGVSWQMVVTSPSPLSISCLTKVSDGYLLFSSDKKYKGTDDGMIWNDSPPLYPSQNIIPPSISVFNDGQAIFVEYFDNLMDTVFRSMDEGQNWQLLPANWKVMFLRWAGDRLFNSTSYSFDHGDTWTTPNLTPSNFYDIVKGKEWLLEANNGIYRTQDFEKWEAGTVGLPKYDYNYFGFKLLPLKDKILMIEYSGLPSSTDNDGLTWKHEPFAIYSRQIAVDDTIVQIQSGSIIRSFDYGETWNLIPNNIESEFFFKSGNYLFAPSSTIDVLSRSADWGETWEEIPFFFVNTTYDNFTACDDTKILFATYSGIQQSTDYGASFTSLNNGLANINTLHSVFGTGDGSYFAVETQNIFRLANDTWIPITGGLTDANGQLLLRPTQLLGSGNSIIMIGTSYSNNEYMLFYSKDGGINWENISGTLPNFGTFKDVKGILFQNKVYIYGVDATNVLHIYSLPLTDFDFTTFTGQVFNDKNANGQKETDEEGMPNVKLKLLATQTLSVSDATGNFNLLASTNSVDSIVALPPSSYSFLTTPPAALASGNLLQGIGLTPNIYDLCIDAALSTPLRPGFNNTLYLTLKNVGTENTDGWVKFMVPSGINIVSTNPAAAMNSGDSMCWNFNDLAPFASLVFTISFVVETNVSIGQIINLRGITGSNYDDANELNNASVLRETVVGSYDPNDKKCVPEFITPQIVQDGERLKYTIRFQNTGNYPATFVRIIDTLEANLDISSVEILSASHGFTWTLRRENVLEFFFENINLPDSTNDEPNSHGFVQFSIKAKKTLQLGDKVQNRAFIYFDYNAPVETNTVNTNVQMPVWTVSPNKVEFDFEVSPNPGHGTINLTFKNLSQRESSFASIVDTAGKLIFEKEILGNEQMVRFNGLAAGSYVVLVKNGGKVVAKKWVSF